MMRSQHLFLCVLYILSVCISCVYGCSSMYHGQDFGTDNAITGTDGSGDTYSLNVCAPVSCATDTTSLACQKHSGSYFSIGEVGTGSYSVVDDKTVQYTVSNANDPCSDSKLPRLSQIQFVCNPTAANPPTATSQITLNAPACTWTFQVQSQQACKAALIPDDNGGSKKLSGGWVFIIILIVVTFVYLIGGAAYLRIRKGATGTDMCPNKDFWKDLFPLMKDGCMFVFGKCRGTGKGSETYSNI